MEITDSRLAMYEGIIALAWADGVLNEREKHGLCEIINNNPRLTDTQRQDLCRKVERKIELKDVWARITDKLDRAHLLDISSVIFFKDGEYCRSEKELYDLFLAQHLTTLDTQQNLREIRDMAIKLRIRREAEEKNIENTYGNLGLAGRLGKFLEKHF